MNTLTVNKDTSIMNSATQWKEKFIGFIKKKPRPHSKYKNIEEIGFRKITENDETVYLMGNAMIAKCKNKQEESKVENTLLTTDWDILIPVIGSMINTINELTKIDNAKQQTK